MSSWEDTILWNYLKKSGGPEAKDIEAALRPVLSNIEDILQRADTSPEDFTLHDAEHSFRVAQNIGRIIPQNTLSALSVYELALLLLSSYVHDIGMTPESMHVRIHHEYLITGEDDLLSEKDQEEFQNWLDFYYSGIVPPLIREKPSVDSLSEASRIITHFSRDKHVRWGADWINSNISPSTLGSYQEWIEDLSVLCQSHGEGKDYLLSERFDTRMVGAHGHFLNLRYLALALRVADILDIDPERTPAVIFQHRDISPESVIFWKKDHAISSSLVNNQVRFSARPKSAAIHRAIDDTIGQINRELELALFVKTSKPLDKYLDQDTHHSWELLPKVIEDVQPFEQSYEYINGAFRPNTEKLLGLLSGVALYGNPLVAIRELLQNAFDSVHERIAYQRLLKPDPSSVELEEILAEEINIEIRLEIDQSDDAWLICRDDGIGMTKAIIENHLLVSGTETRPDLIELERKCIKAGFELSRTGEFGIGVLSYFMIGDHVVIHTKRAFEDPKYEMTGWLFQTSGIGSFGELRRDAECSLGTEIRLHIRDDIIQDDPSGWYEQIANYIQENVSKSPCNLIIHSNIPNTRIINFSSGWSTKFDQLARIVLEDLNPRRSGQEELPMDLLSAGTQERIVGEQQHWSTVRSEAIEALKFRTFFGDLPDAMGSYRIHIPYFQLLGGPSLAFLRPVMEDANITLSNVGKGYAYFPTGNLKTSWKGMRIGQVSASSANRSLRVSLRGYYELTATAIIEIDWTSGQAGDPSVDRAELIVRGRTEPEIASLVDQAARAIREFALESAESEYYLLNTRLADVPPDDSANFKWIHYEETPDSQIAHWIRQEFPLIDSITFAYSKPPSEISLAGKNISILPCLPDEHEDDHYDGVTWHGNHILPDRVVKWKRFQFQMAPIWVGNQLRATDRDSDFPRCGFPPDWVGLAGVRFFNYSKMNSSIYIWNDANSLVSLLTDSGMFWTMQNLDKVLNPLENQNEVLSQSERSAAWIALCIREFKFEMWRGLSENYPEFMRDVWDRAFSDLDFSSEKPLYMLSWVENPPYSSLRVISPDGWTRLDPNDDAEQIQEYLPDPGLDWTLAVQDH